MRLIQYWDTPEPPDEVAGWVESFRAMNPEMRHRLYSRDDAAWFIKKRLGPRELKAFEACAVPAMQSDYFRLCAILAEGGAYVDVDCRCVEPLYPFLKQAPVALLLMQRNRLINGLILARERGNPLVEAALALATDNIENRRFSDIVLTAGPGVFNALWATVEPEPGDPADPLARAWRPPDELMTAAAAVAATRPGLADAFAALTRRHRLSATCLADVEASYKDGPRHWINWQGSPYRA